MSGVIDLIVPKEKKFFESLNRQILLLDSSIKNLAQLIKKEKVSKKELKELTDYLHDQSDKVDDIDREIVNFLHNTFITPIDRDEIKSLSTSIGFIVDSIEKIAYSIYYFKLQEFDEHFLKQIILLEESIDALKMIFEEPLSSKHNRLFIELIRRHEREADRAYRKALGDLFNNGHNTIDIIKRKELYEITEDAIDDATHMVDVIETVIINNS